MNLPSELGEVWRVVPSAPRYMVSSHGRIWSTYFDRLRMLQLNRQGYFYVVFSGGRQRSVSTVVAEAFLGQRPEGQEVRHLDGNSQNNHLENLAYGTHLQNMADQRAHGTNHNTTKTRCPEGHEYSSTNVIVKSSGGRGCRICVTAAQREKRQTGGRDLMPHGVSKYTSEGCRCAECREAWRPYAHERKAARIAKTRLEGLPLHVNHGASAYNNWGCRCALCTEAFSEKKRLRKRRLAGMLS